MYRDRPRDRLCLVRSLGRHSEISRDISKEKNEDIKEGREREQEWMDFHLDKKRNCIDREENRKVVSKCGEKEKEQRKENGTDGTKRSGVF